MSYWASPDSSNLTVLISLPQLMSPNSILPEIVSRFRFNPKKSRPKGRDPDSRHEKDIDDCVAFP
jgi:hypothetical protein